MTIEELDYYLKKLTDSEINYLEQIKKDFHYENNEEVFKNDDYIKQNYHFQHSHINTKDTKNIISFQRLERFHPIDKYSHSNIEMSYVYSGTIHEVINGKSITLSQGDIIILDMNVKHSFEAAGYQDILINFIISSQYFYNNFYETHKYDDYLLFHTAQHSHFHHLISCIMLEQLNADLFSFQNIDYYLMLIFNELIRIYNTQDKNLKKSKRLKKSYNFFDIKNYIGRNLGNADLQTTANYFQFHPNNLNQYIKQMTGDNFASLVTKERLERACFLLLHTDLAVESIGYESGFININIFYKKFKEFYHQTPKNYRMQNRDHNLK